MKTINNFIISSLTDDNGTVNKDIISIIFRPAIASLFFIMIAITFIQVIFRYILNSALPWAGEIAIFLFIWINSILDPLILKSSKLSIPD